MAPHNNCTRAAAWLLVASATGSLPVKAQRAPKSPAGEGISADEEGRAPCVDLDAPCDLLKLDMYRGNCATAYMVVGGARLGADEACCACSAAGASRPLRANNANASCVLGQTGVLRRQAGEPAGKAEQQEEWAGVAPEFFDPGPPRPLSERTDNHYGEGVLPGYVFVDSRRRADDGEDGDMRAFFRSNGWAPPWRQGRVDGFYLTDCAAALSVEGGAVFWPELVLALVALQALGVLCACVLASRQGFAHPLYDIDAGTCALATCCPCVLFGHTAQWAHGRTYMYKSPDGSPDSPWVWGAAYCGSICLGSGMKEALSAWTRFTLRRRIEAQGNGCEDACIHCCAHPCALAQEAREVEANWRAGGKAARADKWHGAAAQDIHLVAKALEGRAALGAGPDGGIVTPVPTVTTTDNPVVSGAGGLSESLQQGFGPAAAVSRTMVVIRPVAVRDSPSTGADSNKIDELQPGQTVAVEEAVRMGGHSRVRIGEGRWTSASGGGRAFLHPL